MIFSVYNLYYLFSIQIVVSKVAKTPEEVETYAECTLLAASLCCDASPSTRCDQSSCIKSYIAYLLDNEFITRNTVSRTGSISQV